MFCPGCGIEENQTNQYCRACGTDLRPARKMLEMPDSITASAATAREEIGRAFAAKIRDAEDGRDLKIVAENVLPEIEKFLESPEEKRLRRMRLGTLLSSIGMGVAIAFIFIHGATRKEEFIILAGLGTVLFFIGLSFLLNGVFLTVPKKNVADRSGDADEQRALDGIHVTTTAETNELMLPAARQEYVSVTDKTTRALSEKQPLYKHD